MARTKMWIAGGAAALLVAGTGAGIAAASGHGDDSEGPITGSELDRRRRGVAVHLGSAFVNEVERVGGSPDLTTQSPDSAVTSRRRAPSVVASDSDRPASGGNARRASPR